MNVSELSESNYLTKEDVTPPLTVAIEEVAFEEIPDPRTGKKRQKWVMYFKGVEKGLILNVTNGNALERITGSPESDDWIGKRIQLWNNPEVINPSNPKNPGGIRIRAVGDNGPAPTRRSRQAVEEHAEASELRERRRIQPENYTEPSVDQVNRDLAEASELNRRKHQPQVQPVEDDDIPF